jgi:hypothetical protein
MADRAEELLPVEYFHVVFTLPDTFNALALANKRVVYGLLFEAVGHTLLEVAANPKHLGAKIGFIGILHTWGQSLCLHPHVHCVVPGGGLTPEGKWVNCRARFFLPVRVLSRVFRGKFIGLMRDAFRAGRLRGPRDEADLEALLDAAAATDWVVYAKPPFGKLRAGLRRPRPSPQVPVPLHPPHRHLRPQDPGRGRADGHLRLQGLRPRRPR